jgi:hypothetical protein
MYVLVLIHSKYKYTIKIIKIVVTPGENRNRDDVGWGEGRILGCPTFSSIIRY